MKNGKTRYSKNSITYWPSYEGGKIILIYFGALGILFIATLIWLMLENPSEEALLEVKIVLPIIVVAICALFSFVYRVMQTKITVSDVGIEYFKNDDNVEKVIPWEDISAIYFKQEQLSYGRKTCRVFLKNSTCLNKSHNDCDFVLPVYGVDINRLLELIPKHLWKNNPSDNWSTLK